MKTFGRDSDWREVAAGYRVYLYSIGELKGAKVEGEPVSPGFSPERVAEVLAEGGELTRYELLHCRVRYFSDGAVLGTQAFVDEVFAEFRRFFGRTRWSGARPMRGGGWGGLCTLRALRKAPICLPATG